MLNVYGKTPEQLGNVTKLFFAVLANYPAETIKAAFLTYLKTNSTMPTPADIENIINPPRPKPDWPVYIALKKRIHDGYFPLSDERQFLRDCEQYAKDNLAEQQGAWADAQRQIESFKTLQLADYSE